ncbi:hypothetical protein HY489_05415 [Candidatus Woesearchaeota archaeon]|nr:hypothetical protein [Candidatus Woesearchaeota archaeon]
MLTKDAEKKILNYVYTQPRTIQEISKHLGKNWRTADSYVDKIIKESGSLAVRTFREGTRGALKLVYWNNTERIHNTEFQERLFKRIESGRRKHDFSPLDIYNYVPENKRSARCGSYTVSNELFNQDLVSFLKSAKKHVLIYTGNCSFVNLYENGTNILNIFQELAERGVSIKVLTRVDFSSLKNLQKLLAINYSIGKETVEIKHCEQPLRGFLVDETSLRLKESLDPSLYCKGELPPDMNVILYDIRDSDWVKWGKDVFYTLFRTSIAGQKRLQDLRSIAKQDMHATLH